MPTFTKAMAIAAIGAAVVNVLLFFFWLNTIEAAVATPVEDRARDFDTLSLNVTLLSLMIVVAGIVIALAGIFGYVGIKAAATDTAEREAKKEVERQMQLYRLTRGSRPHGDLTETFGAYNVEEAQRSGAERAKEGE